jgi:hypothetical protein
MKFWIIDENHDFGSVILYTLNHDSILSIESGNHHSPRESNTWARDITVASNLIARIDNTDIGTFCK